MARGSFEMSHRMAIMDSPATADCVVSAVFLQLNRNKCRLNGEVTFLEGAMRIDTNTVVGAVI